MATADASSEQDEQQPLAREGEQVAPELKSDAFHCMHCGVLARQMWKQVWVKPTWSDTYSRIAYWHCACINCDQASLWRDDGRIVDPIVGGGPRPHIEMPADVREDYEEAQAIVDRSPRGACGLLRLAVQKLCGDLGESGKDINRDIASLVEKGLTPDVQEALDSLRVIGNNAVHPGEMDLKDDPETASALFDLLNFIVDDRIAQPKKRKAIFDNLPEGARAAIRKRDGRQEEAAAAD